MATTSTASAIKITPVTAAQLIASLKVCARARIPAFTWGSPGIGKSDIHRQLARELQAFLIDVRASQWDAVDTRGVPYVEQMLASGQKTTRWAVPSVFPSAEFAAQHPLVVIFLDELNAAPPSVQAALYQLILDRRLGDYVLPPNVVIFAAGNLETDRAVTHRMSQALAGRFIHFQMLVDPVGWEKWALANGIHIASISYMRWRPDALHEWDSRSASKAQPTPRTHEFLSKLIIDCEANGVPADVVHALCTGTIGEARGTEFAGFLRIFRTMQDPAGVILNPDAASISEDPAVNYALCGALAERATPGNIDRILRYGERLRDDVVAGPEFMTLLVRTATIRHPEVMTTMGFIKWAADDKNSGVIL